MTDWSWLFTWLLGLPTNEPTQKRFTILPHFLDIVLDSSISVGIFDYLLGVRSLIGHGLC